MATKKTWNGAGNMGTTWCRPKRAQGTEVTVKETKTAENKQGLGLDGNAEKKAALPSWKTDGCACAGGKRWENRQYAPQIAFKIVLYALDHTPLPSSAEPTPPVRVYAPCP